MSVRSSVCKRDKRSHSFVSWSRTLDTRLSDAVRKRQRAEEDEKVDMNEVIEKEEVVDEEVEEE